MRKTKAQDSKPKKTLAVMIPPEHEPLLTEVHEAVKAMGRRTTGQAFDLGYQFARAKAVLPEKMFGRWMSTVCGYTPRQGRNYVAIHVHLQENRARLEGSAVSPTVMFVLASATPEKIEEVVTSIESGQRLTVGQVKALIKTDQEERVETKAAVGGVVGLRRAAEAKMKDEVAFFLLLGKRILKAVEVAADLIVSGKHVSKKALADKIEADCYKAAALLRSVIYPKQVDVEQTSDRLGDDNLPAGWVSVPGLFIRLGDAPRWPGKEEFPAWVTDTVLPTLRFVVLGDALPVTETAVPGTPAEAGEHESRLALESVPPLDLTEAENLHHACDDAPSSDSDVHAGDAVPVLPKTRAKTAGAVPV
ncbi:MAG: hypothetical protein WC048_02315 [Rhizobium sp.]